MKHVMYENFEKIQEILKYEKILRYEDLYNLKFRDNQLSSLEYPWVKDVALLLQESYWSAQTSLCFFEGQYFLIDRISTMNKNNLTKYACLFPGRTIISAGAMSIGLDGNIKINMAALHNLFFQKK